MSKQRKPKRDERLATTAAVHEQDSGTVTIATSIPTACKKTWRDGYAVIAPSLTPDEVIEAAAALMLVPGGGHVVLTDVRGSGLGLVRLIDKGPGVLRRLAEFLAERLPVGSDLDAFEESLAKMRRFVVSGNVVFGTAVVAELNLVFGEDAEDNGG